MGYAGKLELKLKAQTLRKKKGLSVKEIQRRLKVSRSSVSLWVRDVKLTKEQLQRLYLNKKTGVLKGSIIAARNKVKEREELTRKLVKEGIKEIGSVSKRDRFIAGIMLYGEEGSKTDGDVSFVNSGPEFIKFMMNWFREFCKIPEDKFRAHLYLHKGLDEKKAKKFWSRLTKIPKNQFYKTYIAVNRKNRIHKNIHLHGVLKIRFSSREIHRKIRGWIEGVISNPSI